MSGLLTHTLVLMLTLSAWSALPHAELLEHHEPASTEGRQTSMDVDCEGYSFEDLFEYDFALFGLNVLEDWATGEMSATAWVNNSNSAIVRANLDGLFEGISDNDYISTDEREAIRSIGPSCIADMDTRLTMTEGAPHSGEGTLNPFEFVESGINLNEVNLVPLDHPEVRTCQTFGSTSGCKEVPTTATDNLEITLGLQEDEDNNVRWDQLPNSGVSNFTLSMNITNMSNAALVVTFPALSGLRLVDFRITDNNPASGENCDYIDAPDFSYLPNGALHVTQLVNFDRTLWDLQCHMFMDFTTQAPLTNSPPAWTANAPANGTVVGTGGPGTTMFSTGLESGSWATDDDAWRLSCDFAEDGWTVTTNVLGDLFVNQPTDQASSMATCHLVDPLGANDTNDTRTWSFGTVITGTASISQNGQGITILLNNTGLVDSAVVQLRTVQDGLQGSVSENTTVTSGTDSEVTMTMNGLRPGTFNIEGTVHAANMLPFSFALHSDLIKPNSPPIVNVQINFFGENATWSDNLQRFTVTGTVSDPDLEGVSMRLSLCGADYTDFTIENINWAIEVSTAICLANNLEVNEVLLTVTDDSGASTQLQVSIERPDATQDDPNIGNPEPSMDSDGALPSLSFMATLSMLGAAMFLRRQNRD